MIGTTLRELRLKRNLSVTKVASDLSIDRSRFFRIENHKIYPTPEEVILLESYFGEKIEQNPPIEHSYEGVVREVTKKSIAQVQDTLIPKVWDTLTGSELSFIAETARVKMKSATIADTDEFMNTCFYVYYRAIEELHKRFLSRLKEIVVDEGMDYPSRITNTAYEQSNVMIEWLESFRSHDVTGENF
jgi:transcriptional regulator with XRE-family HTH domain